jgi:DNA-binding CsgD family transcriptional regulator
METDLAGQAVSLGESASARGEDCMEISRFSAHRHKVVLRYRLPETGLIQGTVDRLARLTRAGCPRNAAGEGSGARVGRGWRAPVIIAARVRDHRMEEMGMLVGRTKEEGALEDALGAVRDGLGGVLVLRGEAGIGKTALLDWAAGMAGDMRVARVAGVESEMDLGFAGLHQMLAPLLDGLERLPGPQRAALQSAFGLTAGPPPDRFLVGLATLTLLTDAAASQPVLCVVDNAQWLDRASAEVLGLVARRLLADRVGMLFAVQDGEERAVVFEGLPELTVDGLAEPAAHELLVAAAGGPVDPRVSERIVAETVGNPLGLVEFGGELTAEERSGAVPLTGPLRFGGRLEKLYLSRVQELPVDAQTLLLVLAVDQLGDPAKVWRAAGRLGIGPEAMELPAVERLVTGTPGLQFRHPLMRSVVYHGAPCVARRRVHEALAAVSDPVRDPDRRAWHLAQAIPGPDEEVAAELERSAGRARGRGGWAGSAAFLERSADLTQDPERRGRRLLEAAGARLAAGETLAARALLDRAAPDMPDPMASAQAGRLKGEILFAAGEPARATSVLLEAARVIGPYDARRARSILLEAFAAQLVSERAAGVAGILEALRSVPRAEESQATQGDLLLDSFTAVAERHYTAGFALLRRAVEGVTAGAPMPDDAPQRFLAFRLAVAELYDESVWRDIAGRWVARARDRGALGVMMVGLEFQACSQLVEGRFAAAEATIAEARALAEAMGNRIYAGALSNVQLELLAWRGHEADARPLAARQLRVMADTGSGIGLLRVHKSLAALELGLGNYQEALRHALKASIDQPLLSHESRPDVLIEAAVRCGDRTAAAAALEAVAPWWQACDTPWSLGLLARCQALLADDGHAEDGYRRSIEHLRQCQVAPELARSHLLYGEWLRRQRRRRGAREQLRAAFELFAALGMEAFASRAQAELRAAGEHTAPRRAGTTDTLTLQEARIAQLAAEGATNQEIAAQLFVSASTVDYHLRKVFRKLGVTRRSQLSRGLSAPDLAAGQRAS